LDALTIGIIGVVALFGLVLLKFPIAMAMMTVGIVGFALQSTWSAGLSLLANEPSALLSSVDMATVPLFLLMGTFSNVAGFSVDIYDAAAAFLGRRRGGLAYATIGGCAAFGVVCGSSTATAATFAKIALPEMLKRGYSPGFSSGAIAAGGTIKALIPPSLIMILYCVITKTFIYDLFAAAIIPAMLTIALNLCAIAIKVRLDPTAAPAGQAVPWPERRAALRRAVPSLFLIVTVFGGLYSGIFTVNEAASVAAVVAFAFAALRGRLTIAKIVESMCEGAKVTVMLYTILIGASVFSYFVTLARLPEALVAFVGGLDWSPRLIIFLLLFLYIVLGSLFDELAALLITLPFVLPIVIQLGYDPIWWGIVMLIELELALIHPPVGVIVFIIHSLAPKIPLKTIYIGVLPFLIADFAVLIILGLFPGLALWLPELLAR
jgi:C4-dicarboxylate transporter DctM subunit